MRPRKPISKKGLGRGHDDREARDAVDALNRVIRYRNRLARGGFDVYSAAEVVAELDALVNNMADIDFGLDIDKGDVE